ncbi:MAG: class II glutamine amidotransferase [Candidatus Odinarchaeia archaeon]
MCELLGLCFNVAVRPKISFKAFRGRSEENPDGWGVAFYPGRSAFVLKEPLKAKVSHLSEFIAKYPEIRSKIFVAHVRLTSVGNVNYDNTHPFSREVNGKENMFSHITVR